MKNKKIILIILLIIISILSITITILLLLNTEDVKSLSDILDKTDDAIALGYFDRALAACKQAFDLTKSTQSYLNVLKRFFSIAQITKKYNEFEQYSLRAHERIPGNEKLVSIAIYAGIKNGNMDRVLSIADNYTDLPEIDSFRAEAYLRSNRDLDTYINSITGQSKDILHLELENDPDKYILLGEKWDDKRLIKDAALLLMKEGDKERALQLSRDYLSGREYDELAAFIAYDNNELKLAEERLLAFLSADRERADLDIILSDINLKQRDYKSAKANYMRALIQDASFSVVPYINLAWLNKGAGNNKAAYDILKQAIILFPDNERITIDLASLLLKMGNEVEALEIMNTFLKHSPDNLTVNLFLLNITKDNLVPVKYITKLNELFNQYPQSEELCRQLAWYQAGYLGLNLARRTLKKYETATGQTNTSWLLHFKGLLKSLAGDYNGALEFIDKALLIKDEWSIRYNRAIIYLKNGQLKLAEQDLWQAFNLLDSNIIEEKEDVYLSLIRAKIAYIKYMFRDIEAARREIDYALQLNPDNDEALILKKELEIY